MSHDIIRHESGSFVTDFSSEMYSLTFIPGQTEQDPTPNFHYALKQGPLRVPFSPPFVGEPELIDSALQQAVQEFEPVYAWVVNPNVMAVHSLGKNTWIRSWRLAINEPMKHIRQTVYEALGDHGVYVHDPEPGDFEYAGAAKELDHELLRINGLSLIHCVDANLRILHTNYRFGYETAA